MVVGRIDASSIRLIDLIRGMLRHRYHALASNVAWAARPHVGQVRAQTRIFSTVLRRTAPCLPVAVSRGATHAQYLPCRLQFEAGSRFVGVDAPGWDVHYNCFPSLQTDLIPYADRAYSALITDLEERGLLDDTLVVMMGEMGRTPRINSRAGRDHWSSAQTIIFAGGGVKPGQIIGATDKTAAAPTTDPVSVSDLLRTISNLMGIDADRTYLGPLGRPVPIVDGGKFIEKLI